jgi:hypothetical protein
VTPDGTRVLITSHKASRPFVAGNAHPFDSLDLNHFGSIDGRNDWSEANHVVHFGVHYRNDADAYVTDAAMRGTDATQKQWNRYMDIKRAMDHGWTTIAAVQASTRGAARRVIDAEGHTAEAHIWLLLPESQKDLSDALVRAHVEQLPGIKVQFDWDIDLNDGKKRKPNHMGALMSFVEFGMKPGESMAATRVKGVLGIPKATWERLMKELRDPTTVLADHAREHGVVYEVQRHGKTQKAHLRRV